MVMALVSTTPAPVIKTYWVAKVPEAGPRPSYKIDVWKAARSAGFYAVAYKTQYGTVISCRGTNFTPATGIATVSPQTARLTPPIHLFPNIPARGTPSRLALAPEARQRVFARNALNLKTVPSRTASGNTSLPSPSWEGAGGGGTAGRDSPS